MTPSMQLITSILALATVASAIDMLGHGDRHCNDWQEPTPNARWIGINPDRCYGTSEALDGISFRAIPKNWRIRTRGFREDGCHNLNNEFSSDGRDTVCHGSGDGNLPYRSGAYSFVNKKRSTDSSDLTTDPTQDCLGPDILSLKDGQEYVVTGLADDIFSQMVS